MYFIFALLFAILGAGIILSDSKISSKKTKPIIDTDQWIDAIVFWFKTYFRKILKYVVFHLVGWYRYVTRDISIHSSLKRKVRELLYEHYQERKSKQNKSSLHSLK